VSKFTPLNVTNGQNVSAVNSNFTEIANQLNNLVLYRDNPAGEPNTIEKDIDVNGNSLLNVDALSVQSLTVGGTDLVDELNDAVQAAESASATATAAAGAANSSAVSASASAAAASATLANALTKANNLSDVSNVTTARTNLGLGTAAVANTNTAGHAIPFLDGVNVFSNVQTFSSSPVVSTTGPAALTLSGAVNNGKQIFFSTAGSTRIAIFTGNNETGSNAGSDLLFGRYTDGGVFIDLPLALNRSTGILSINNGVAGKTDGSSAVASVVGEYISNTAAGVAAFGTGVAGNATSISLTAGDWDVSGLAIAVGGTTISSVGGGISTVSATFGAVGTYASQVATVGQGTAVTPVVRLNLTSTTTVYLVANLVYTGTPTMTGFIRARRVR
jgi:hypothetical protein